MRTVREFLQEHPELKDKINAHLSAKEMERATTDKGGLKSYFKQYYIKLDPEVIDLTKPITITRKDTATNATLLITPAST